jgi:cytochrome b6-f complex iron-sulfur subunit
MLSRREILQCSAICALAPACASLPQVAQIRASGSAEEVSVNVRDVRAVANHGVSVVPADGLELPILVIENEAGWRAFSSGCTHLGCEIRPQGQKFVCPCHGAQFSHEGEVLRGPAQKNLTEYSVREQGELLYIRIAV